MYWTKRKPTASGWYWFSLNIRFSKGIAFVSVEAGVGITAATNFDLELFTGWFSNQSIPEPAPPIYPGEKK